MVKYISIGYGCNVKHQIDKHMGNCETLFFDNLMTDMKSVIEIFECKEIDELLYFENIGIKNPERKVNDKHITVALKSLSNCVSIHDVPYHYSNEDISDFIEKYKRR